MQNNKEFVENYQSFFEMSYSKDNFEHKLIMPTLTKVIKHFIKYELTFDKFNTQLKDKNLGVFLTKGNYRAYWRREIKRDILNLFDSMDQAVVKSGRKDDIYKETLQDCFFEIDANDYDIDAVKDAISNYKNKAFVVKQFRLYRLSLGIGGLRTTVWMNLIIDFLKDMRPSKNKAGCFDLLSIEVDRFFKYFDKLNS